MAYALTSANTLRDLLAAIVTFAQSQGWVVEYNNASASTGNGGQIALSSGECHIAIGEVSAAANPIAVAGGAQDAFICMALANSINTGLSQFWSHPGSLVTASNNTARVAVNDLYGPMTEVHFFGTSEWVWCVVRSAASRYTSFGFGLLNTMGMTGPRIAFAFGGLHSWYDPTIPSGVGIPRRCVVNSSNGSNTFWPSMNSSSTVTGISRSSSVNLRIPSGFLNTGLGFPAGDVFSAGGLALPVAFFNANQGLVTSNFNLTGYLLDFAIGNALLNQPTTGGVPLFEVPVALWKDNLFDSLVMLGSVPGVRIANIRDIQDGGEETYGTEVWKFFPWKQGGLTTDLNQCNTYTNGFAFQKVA